MEAIDILSDKGHQVLNLPKEFTINDTRVYLKKTGNIISIIPFNNPWQNLFDSLPLFAPDFMDERQQPNQTDRTTFD